MVLCLLLLLRWLGQEQANVSYVQLWGPAPWITHNMHLQAAGPGAVYKCGKGLAEDPWAQPLACHHPVHWKTNKTCV